MGNRLSKIYTRTGDDGLTHLGDGKRLAKDNSRLIVLGTVDELNSSLGLVIAYLQAGDSVLIQPVLTKIQHELFNLGGQLCPPYREAVTATNVAALENTIDEWNSHLPPLKEFILPGGNIAAAHCHLARTICRRAERCLVTLMHTDDVSIILLHYLNRLSDLLFVASRMLARETNADEVLWDHER
jgi:cob(I)alamin adenosyltransferase